MSPAAGGIIVIGMLLVLLGVGLILIGGQL